jgi:L-iditol 2-dehydrogenase
VRLARARGAARVFLIDLNRDRFDRAVALVNPTRRCATARPTRVDAIVKLTDGRGDVTGGGRRGYCPRGRH